MAYEAEIERIRGQYGSLESMRSSLGLSRREVCEFLLVDPSAWSRWVKGQVEQAPAHVYRTLELQIEKVSRTKPAEIQWSAEREPIEGIEWREDLNQNVKSQFDILRQQFIESAELKMGWKLLLILNIALVLYVLFR